MRVTRDLIHLINARRHDHWDADAAFDTLADLIEPLRIVIGVFLLLFGLVTWVVVRSQEVEPFMSAP